MAKGFGVGLGQAGSDDSGISLPAGQEGPVLWGNT